MKLKTIKPIFIVSLPRQSNMSDLNQCRDLLSKELEEYHVIVVKSNQDEIDFKCFYEEDFDEVRYQEIQNYVRQQLEG